MIDHKEFIKDMRQSLIWDPFPLIENKAGRAVIAVLPALT
jgi:hypothetical protein